MALLSGCLRGVFFPPDKGDPPREVVQAVFGKDRVQWFAEGEGTAPHAAAAGWTARLRWRRHARGRPRAAGARRAGPRHGRAALAQAGQRGRSGRAGGGAGGGRGGLAGAVRHGDRAADAATGAERWRRGNLDEGSLYDLQCLHGTVMVRGWARLHLFDARTGSPCGTYPSRDPGFSGGVEFRVTGAARRAVPVRLGAVKVTVP
jgi:hypothetical protein